MGEEEKTIIIICYPTAAAADAASEATIIIFHHSGPPPQPPDDNNGPGPPAVPVRRGGGDGEDGGGGLLLLLADDCRSFRRILHGGKLLWRMVEGRRQLKREKESIINNDWNRNITFSLLAAFSNVFVVRKLVAITFTIPARTLRSDQIL